MVISDIQNKMRQGVFICWFLILKKAEFIRLNWSQQRNMKIWLQTFFVLGLFETGSVALAGLILKRFPTSWVLEFRRYSSHLVASDINFYVTTNSSSVQRLFLRIMWNVKNIQGFILGQLGESIVKSITSTLCSIVLQNSLLVYWSYNCSLQFNLVSEVLKSSQEV